MRVYSYVMTLAGKQHMAEEITQEAFYKAFTAKSAFRGESNEVTWLCAIARNLFLDEMRRQSKSAEADLDANADSGVNIESEVEDRDASYRIHQALQELEEPYRRVFELRIFGELSFREIGDICEKTENWARVTYHRAKLKLQNSIFL
ncbi:MAG: sigma-70 family RNA polymerase sigma factor [Acetatifactor sp.]|nr:sigma-70 family RNA polymerase sigma factor [Acetatifactor sp.]